MSVRLPDFDSAHFRATLGRFATGVTVITTAQPGGAPIGVTISSFNTVSLAPPLILWSLTLSSHLLELFQQTDRYVVNILAHPRTIWRAALPAAPAKTATMACPTCAPKPVRRGWAQAAPVGWNAARIRITSLATT